MTRAEIEAARTKRKLPSIVVAWSHHLHECAFAQAYARFFVAAVGT